MKQGLTIVVQLVAGYFLSTIAFVVGIGGNGWEYITLPLLGAFGVWGVGAVLLGAKGMNKFWASLIGGALGSGINAVIFAAGGFGIFMIFVPALGALLGYYFIPMGKK